MQQKTNERGEKRKEEDTPKTTLLVEDAPRIRHRGTYGKE